MKFREYFNCHFQRNILFIKIEEIWCQSFAFGINYVPHSVGESYNGEIRFWSIKKEMELHFVCKKVVNIFKLICNIDFNHISIIFAYANYNIHSDHNNLSAFNFLITNDSLKIFIYQY
jgi:hypothetical protein